MHLIRKREYAKTNLSERGVLGRTIQEEKSCFQCRRNYWINPIVGEGSPIRHFVCGHGYLGKFVFMFST